jgi:hypothetical protein
MSFNSHLKFFSVVHSDRPNLYLNPLPDSQDSVVRSFPLETTRSGVG